MIQLGRLDFYPSESSHKLCRFEPIFAAKNPRSQHKGATGRVRTRDQQLPILCHCQLGQDFSVCHNLVFCIIELHLLYPTALLVLFIIDSGDPGDFESHDTRFEQRPGTAPGPGQRSGPRTGSNRLPGWRRAGTGRRARSGGRRPALPAAPRFRALSLPLPLSLSPSLPLPPSLPPSLSLSPSLSWKIV